jgi:hypothetical protein
MLPARAIFLLVMLGLGTGCLETRTYTLTVHNSLPTDVSICVTKRNGPMERGWESPEQLAAPPHPASDQKTPGVIVPAGKTANSGSFSGQFDHAGGRAILRVYAGRPTLTEMNAISVGSVNRLDVPLDEGANRIEIKQAADGSMTAMRMPGPGPATAASPR